MDTKSTKFKHSLLTKGICLILATLMFSGFAFFTFNFLTSIYIFGAENYFKGRTVEFTESQAFEDQFLTNFYHVNQLLTSDRENLEAAYNEQRNAVINEAVGDYLDRKAEIIKSELTYAVENYDESYFAYEYTADSVVLPSTTVAEGEQTTSVQINTDDDIPDNIEAAQIILASTQGRDFLQYETLVRDSAFDVEWDCNVIVDNDILSYNFYFTSGSNCYFLNESELRKTLLAQYESIADDAEFEVVSEYNNAEYYLSELSGFKYYAMNSDGKVVTNIDNEPVLSELENESAFFFYNGIDTQDGEPVTVYSGIDKSFADSLTSNAETTANTKICVYLADNFINSDDIYANLSVIYNSLLNFTASSTLAIMLILFALAVIFLIILTCLSGHKNGYDHPVTALIDRLPTDLHLLLSFGLIAGIILLTVLVIYEITDYNFYFSLFVTLIPYIVVLVAGIVFMLFAEWLTSVARIVKSGERYFRKMLIVRFIFAIGRLFRRFFRAIKKLDRLLAYKPKKMEKTALLACGVYIAMNVMFIAIAAVVIDMFNTAWAYVIAIALFTYINAIILYFALNYLVKLDKIIDASCRHETADFGNEKVPESLRILSANLTNSNDELSKAIEKAVKDEQTKTELITNVSHDLKTPLTSLITYSDLLDKCDIQDETAQKYISVIHAQSIKLKRLIEDLIEASKVSTGNVTLNSSILNLSELAMQAIAEFAPEMEKNGNEIRFTEPETPPTVYADGSKTYRILSNLLNNAKKYSAANTRVYISVFTDGTDSYFEIKNISSEPLNLSPDELTERFVRGDKSRAREGNGLGLSIAKDLCTLQGGNLNIVIDGDLFKVTVRLPVKPQA